MLEVGIAFRRQRVILWPASALLTGNGVAFILRVPGTEHGDWWSMHGWWIFAGTAAVALLSKYLITFRGRHVFNPSNFGLVLCFLLLGPERADPLEFWWGPMSAWMALALAIIVVGGFAILLRLHLLHIAVGFWVAFAAGLAVLAASGHEMTARWHLGPISGWEFWHTLVFSPEVLVFLFFMITDPRTIPETARGRRAYAIGIGLLAVLLIAPQTTEFATKVAVLGALTIVCAVRPLALLARSRARSLDGLFAPVAARGAEARRAALGAVGVMGAVVFAGLVLLAGIPARPSAAATTPSQSMAGDLPEVTVLQSEEIASRLGAATARRIASDLVEDLRIEAEALVERDLDRATSGATGERLAALWERIRASGGSVVVPDYDLDELTRLARALRRPGAAGCRRRSRRHGRARELRRIPSGASEPRRPGAVRADARARPAGRALPHRGRAGRGARGAGRPERDRLRAAARIGALGHPPHERRAEGRPGLPPRGVPLPDVARHRRDDGRRSVLDRLRRRRLARPLRRELALDRRSTSPGGRSRAACRAARSTGTSEGGSST